MYYFLQLLLIVIGVLFLWLGLGCFIIAIRFKRWHLILLGTSLLLIGLNICALVSEWWVGYSYISYLSFAIVSILLAMFRKREESLVGSKKDIGIRTIMLWWQSRTE